MATTNSSQSIDDMLKQLPEKRKQELISDHRTNVTKALCDQLELRVKESQAQIQSLTPTAAVTPAVAAARAEDSTTKQDSTTGAQANRVLFYEARQTEDQNLSKAGLPARFDGKVDFDWSNDTDTDDDMEELKQKPQKNEHGLTMIKHCDTTQYLKSVGSDLTVVFVKREQQTPDSTYYNGIHLLSTLLSITEASKEVMDSLIAVKNIGSRRDLRAIDITDFLARSGVTITAIAKSEGYEKIITADYSNPIIIEYTVLRHKLENSSLPASWTQLCLLYRRENLLIPFNETGHNIRLGKQFNDKNWSKSFQHYCDNNLNYRITPVGRVDDKTSNSLIRNLNFNNAWILSMPSPAK